jgi:hypothetical protein
MASTLDLPPILLNKDAAEYLSKSPQTLRKWSCLDCAPHGIRPIKINGRLSWRVSDLQKIFKNEDAFQNNNSLTEFQSRAGNE